VAYACSWGVDFGDAEDLVQQLFLKLLNTRPTKPEVPLAYLYRATRNACLNHHRDGLREMPLPEQESWLVNDGASLAEMLAVQEALKELPEEQREAVFLRIWSGMTLTEIAETTATTLNTVASRYRYALEKLRQCLGHYIEK